MLTPEGGATAGEVGLSVVREVILIKVADCVCV